MIKNKCCKLLCLLAAALLIICDVAGCKLSFEEDEVQSTVSEQEKTEKNKYARKAKVAVIQYMNNPALNDCCEGVKKSLENTDFEFEVFVGSEESPEQDCEQTAQDIVINGGYDLAVTIGTPASVSAYSYISSSTRIPVVFCAVTDPVGAGLVVSNEQPVNNCTGVASAFDIKAQINMINDFQPSITKLGVIYSANEQNTRKQIKDLKSEAKKLNINVYAAAVDSPADYAQAAAEIVPEVEAITLLPDNMASVHAWDIINQAIIGNKPVYGVTLSEVKEGCVAGYCYDFKKLGEKAGDTAVSVLRGQSAADTPVEVVRDCTLYVNKDAANQLYIEVPQGYTDVQMVETSYK